jgi:hypothetical protein
MRKWPEKELHLGVIGVTTKFAADPLLIITCLQGTFLLPKQV